MYLIISLPTCDTEEEIFMYTKRQEVELPDPAPYQEQLLS